MERGIEGAEGSLADSEFSLPLLTIFTVGPEEKEEGTREGLCYYRSILASGLIGAP